MSDSPPDAIDQYGDRLWQAVAPLQRQPVTPLTLARLTNAVRQVQAEFLCEHPDYVALRPLSITDNGAGDFQVDAPICTRAEKWEIDRVDQERARLYEQLRVEAEAEREKMRKSEANMRRSHRRLLRRHADRIPPSTKAVFPSLSAGQQYAILKDIDYAVRHRKEEMDG
jgi:hypothetical protein